MQLGTRWSAGAQPPRQVPEQLHAAIAQIEAEHGAAGSWTLTFLEGRAIVELDTGYEVFEDATGEIIARPFQD